MISAKRLFGLVLVAVCCGLAAPVHAQKGALAGVVVDAATGESLIGANVVVEGTTTGATTDLDGRYEIGGLAEGTYTIVVSFMGFDTRRVPEVAVRAGATTRLDLGLSAGAIGLDEVVVEAATARDAEAALLRDRKQAAAVSDAISAETIGRSGASNASDAMKKVTGATVVEGRYVVVRGLGERYMTTQMNGVTLPSADPDRNAVPLDLFPASLLDNIVTTKSFTPDRPGSFTGGAVNLATRAYPERFTFSFSTSSSYNSQIGWGDPYLSFAGGALSFGSLSGANFALPRALAEPGAIPDIGEARRDPAKAQLLDRYSRDLMPQMAPVQREAPANQSFSASAGGPTRLFGRPLGLVAGVSYGRQTGGLAGGLTARYGLEGQVDEVAALTPRYRLTTDVSGVQEALLGFLGGATYRLSPRHELALNVLGSHADEAKARYQAGDTFRQLIQDGDTRTYETRSLRYTERDLRSYQLRGDHALTSGGARLEWSAAYARTRQDEPDARFFSNDFGPGLDGTPEYDINAPAVYDPPTRYYRDLTEAGRSGGADLTLPFDLFGRSARAKTGAHLQQKNRRFHERLFTVVRDNATALSPQGLLTYDGDPAAYFSRMGLYDTLGTGGREVFVFGNYIVDHGSSGDYRGDETVTAAYAMVDAPLGARLRFVGGARYEHTRLDVAGRAGGRDTVGVIRQGLVLPSAGLVYALFPTVNLRLAYGRTLARPTFREMAPYSSFEFIGDVVVVGNPALRQTTADNLDLRAEWFVAPGEIVAVSAFYKAFQNPIERVFVPYAAGSVPEISFQNVRSARVAGLELEVRRRLGALAPWLASFQAGGNFTLTYSEVTRTDAEMAEIRRLDPARTDDTRPLQGQSPYVLNLDLGYTNARFGQEVGLFYNVFGPRMTEVVRGAAPPLYEQPRGVLDLVYAQRLPGRVVVRAGARNLLDTPVRVTQTFKGAAFVTREYRLGRTFSLGVGYTF